jgi:hypothetical protein
MNFTDDFPDALLMQTLGDNVTYTCASGSFAIKAVIEHDVSVVGGDGYTFERRTEAEFLSVAIPFYPETGDLITTSSGVYVVDAVVADDGKYIKLALKHG